jgi:hypothetical protein
MPALCVRRDTKNRALGIIDPVRREQAGEGGDEDAAAVVGDGGGNFGDFGRVAEEAEVVHEEFDAGAGDGDGAFEGVDGLEVLPAEVVGDGG